MKKINVSQIVDPSIQQPFTGLSLAFLQEANKEMIYAVCRNLIISKGLTFSPTIPYFISGDGYGGFAGDGFIFYGNELYRTLENVAGLDYAIVDTTPDSVADPVLFTDSINRNVHGNRYLTYTSTATGSLFNVNDVVNATINVAKIKQEFRLATTSISNTTYVDLGLNYTTPNDGVTRTYLLDAKSIFNGSHPSNTGGHLQIYDETNSVELDESIGYFDNGAGIILFVSTLKCERLVTLAPNTQIKLKIKCSTAASCDFNKSVFRIIEL